ncbi:MAG: superoxide dismutase family protein [Chitinophagaceae bacterium]|nr:superoxide dismutase family protein [Chitinophagaceae bacterium]
MKHIFKPVTILTLLFSGAVLFSCNSGSSTEQTTATTDTAPTPTAAPGAIAEITPSYADTLVEGKAVFTTTDDGKVNMELNLHIPSRANKEVAVHLHEHGDCGEMGNNAHGHWNPTNDTHGKWGSAHFHRGDIGNVTLDADGNGKFQMQTDLWAIGGDDSTKNILNRAVIVHGGVDDYVTQPTGNAGNRIGCAVIK